MRLAARLSEDEDALRADLQQYYGIDLDHAMAGAHSPRHVAALADNLPPDARVHVLADPDAMWTLEHVLLADVRNILASLVWGMSDKRKRGARPRPVGPSWMTRRGTRKLAARAVTVDELKTILAKPRRTTKEVSDG